MWLRCKIGAGDKHFVPIVAWACLYAAFLSVALLVRLYVDASGAAEIWCWDYRMFVNQIQCWDYISYFGFRHPGLGVVLSPLIAAEHLWVDMYLVFMPTVALFTACADEGQAATSDNFSASASSSSARQRGSDADTSRVSVTTSVSESSVSSAAQSTTVSTVCAVLLTFIFVKK